MRANVEDVNSRSTTIPIAQPDGYIEVRDRLKDIITLGGENISSSEVEGAL